MSHFVVFFFFDLESLNDITQIATSPRYFNIIPPNFQNMCSILFLPNGGLETFVEVHTSMVVIHSSQYPFKV